MNDDLLHRHLATLDALEAAMARIPEARWAQAPAEGGWSAAEIFDHVGRLAMGYGFPRMEACLEGRGGPGRRSLLGVLFLGAPWLAGTFRLRQRFPPELAARVISRAEAQSLLETLRGRTRAAWPRLREADPDCRVHHLRLGWLNAEEWFRFLELHARHHLKGQLRRLG
jgi:hypothetical protein